MKMLKYYSPDGDADQGGNLKTNQESASQQGGTHEPGNTPLDDQEELPGGFIHGHVDQDEDDK
ncbi:hypothetical protein [Spirosoma pomorum]|jgi:hypothetical protein